MSTNVGENLTLKCFHSSDALGVYWFKQSLGQEPRLISTLLTFNKILTLYGEFSNSRFTSDAGTGKDHLMISNLSTSDSAFYYCIKRLSITVELEGIIYVSVKVPARISPASVHLSAVQSIQSEDSMSLNCTVHIGSCEREHSVYWFKNSGGSQPGLIYTQGGRNDQCRRNNNTQTRTCLYNLPMKRLNLSPHETYYCAVAACGHILFEEGLKRNSEGEFCFSILN